MAAQITACFKTCFWALNNGTNTSNLTSANVGKSRCVINLNFASDRETPRNAYSIRSGAKTALILYFASLVNPDSTILTQKDGLR